MHRSKLSVTAPGSDEYNGGSVRLKVENTTYGDRWNNASVEASKQPAWRGPKASTIEIYYQNSVTGKDLGTTAPHPAGLLHGQHHGRGPDRDPRL